MRTACVVGWSTTHWWKSGKTLPKLMPPMHTRDAVMSVFPRVAYSTMPPYRRNARFIPIPSTHPAEMTLVMQAVASC